MVVVLPSLPASRPLAAPLRSAKKCEIVNPTVEEKLVRLSVVSWSNNMTRQGLGLDQRLELMLDGQFYCVSSFLCVVSPVFEIVDG